MQECEAEELLPFFWESESAVLHRDAETLLHLPAFVGFDIDVEIFEADFQTAGARNLDEILEPPQFDHHHRPRVLIEHVQRTDRVHRLVEVRHLRFELHVQRWNTVLTDGLTWLLALISPNVDMGKSRQVTMQKRRVCARAKIR